jgi:hypothetical protein
LGISVSTDVFASTTLADNSLARQIRSFSRVCATAGNGRIGEFTQFFA